MSRSDEAISDGTLIAAIRAGDQERFAELVARYRGPLLRVARSRLGRDEWAEDAVQETFLCVVKSLASYDSRFGFRTWLWTILLNQCRRTLAKQRRWPNIFFWGDRRAPDESLGERLPGRELPPLEQLLVQERSDLLSALLRRLPERIADALRLRFFGDLSFPEIAETLGCSQSTAKNRVRDGLVQLGAMLGHAVSVTKSPATATRPDQAGETP